MYGAFKTELDLPRAEVKFKYIILSQPRTGSTMVSSALERSGLAGVPVEYFNPAHLRELQQPLTRKILLDYYSDVMDRRTTANGVFGMKLHFDQFRPLFMRKDFVTQEGFDFLRSFDRVVITARRDKLAQAISNLVALRTRRWNSMDQVDEGKQNYEFSQDDVPVILQRVRDAVIEDMCWAEICSNLRLPALKIFYEDLCRSPQNELKKVFGHLGLEATDIAPRTVKMSRDSNREAKRMVLKAIGVDFDQPSL